MDLIRVLVPYQDVSAINQLYQQCISNLPKLKSSKEQKKAYRLLEEICGSSTEGCQEFLKNNRKDVQKLLKKSLDSAAVSSKGHINHKQKFNILLSFFVIFRSEIKMSEVSPSSSATFGPRKQVHKGRYT